MSGFGEYMKYRWIEAAIGVAIGIVFIVTYLVRVKVKDWRDARRIERDRDADRERIERESHGSGGDRSVPDCCSRLPVLIAKGPDSQGCVGMPIYWCGQCGSVWREEVMQIPGTIRGRYFWERTMPRHGA